MGYDVHVTRGDWWDDDRDLITAEEWTAVVQRDGDLTITGEVTASTPAGDTLTYRNDLLAMWTGHPSGDSVPFDFRDGRVVVKNPDEAVLAKLVEIATALNAVVQGDEGETYS